MNTCSINSGLDLTLHCLFKTPRYEREPRPKRREEGRKAGKARGRNGPVQASPKAESENVGLHASCRPQRFDSMDGPRTFFRR